MPNRHPGSHFRCGHALMERGVIKNPLLLHKVTRNRKLILVIPVPIIMIITRRYYLIFLD